MISAGKWLYSLPAIPIFGQSHHTLRLMPVPPLAKLGSTKVPTTPTGKLMMTVLKITFTGMPPVHLVLEDERARETQAPKSTGDILLKSWVVKRGTSILKLANIAWHLNTTVKARE
ncbi:hypothetical protein R1flu_013812 [Riccia fluitans]|uniref:Uncharacterized protein n=1 Tax=Riccia fluitans TaxID=41844 RepID=A0ABD1YEC0_9MARC